MNRERGGWILDGFPAAVTVLEGHLREQGARHHHAVQFPQGFCMVFASEEARDAFLEAGPAELEPVYLQDEDEYQTASGRWVSHGKPGEMILGRREE